MQIPKVILIVCALATASLEAWAADSDAQDRAREALRKKLAELEGQPVSATQASSKPQPASAPSAAPSVSATSAQKTDPAAIERAREAMRQKLNQGTPEPPIRVAEPAPKVQPAPTPPPVVAAPPPAAVATTPAADQEAIDKAREAMRQKLNQGTTPAQVTGTPPRVQPPPPPPTAAPAPPAAPAAPAIVTAPAADPEAIEKAREAMRQKLNTMQTQQPAPTVTGTTPAPARVSTPAPVADSAAIEKARAATREKLTTTQPAAATPTTRVVTTPQPQPTVATTPQVDERAEAEARKRAEKEAAMEAQARAKAEREAEAQAAAAAKAQRKAKTQATTEFRRIEPPPLPISDEQQQRLAELLRKYRADEISPEQYHEERAKILAGK